jgi:hypothetical protein
MKFWMVWRDGGHAPQVKHESEEGARAEAERLARLNPSGSFVVLEALAAYQLAPTPVNVEELLEDDGVPF